MGSGPSEVPGIKVPDSLLLSLQLLWCKKNLFQGLEVYFLTRVHAWPDCGPDLYPSFCIPTLRPPTQLSVALLVAPKKPLDSRIVDS